MAHVVIEIFLWALGLCVGSFLNVVIYRLPRGLSIAQPRRSFCPSCHKGIVWYDNLPILSWLLLKGRCRHCAMTISVQYPLVEALTGVLFVLTYHLLFVDAARVGLASPSLPGDAPLLLSWLVLVAGLIACSAMDIVSYMIDTRITNLVLVLGVVAHVVWPQGGYLAEPVSGLVGGGMIAAGIVTLVMLIWTMRQWGDEAEMEDAPESSPDAPVPESTGVRLGGRIAVFLFVAVTIGLIALSHPAAGAVVGAQPVVPVVFVLVFMATVVVGGQQREVDEEIHTAIEEEQPQARGVALRELLWLSPIILAGVAAALAMTFFPGLQDAWGRLIGWQPGGLAPIAGLAYSVHGAVVGAAAGWFLRIFFTLAFGKEAFGVGDIFILAAAGAAAGWDIALLGLLLSVGVALAGWIFGLLLKSTVMIPFGPWLAIGFLLALYWNQAAARVAEAYRINLSFAWQNRPDVLMMVAGLMLVGTAAAIALSRLFRRLIAPEDS